MPGLATICVLFSHKANGEKTHKYRLCRHLPSYIGLGLKIVSRLILILKIIQHIGDTPHIHNINNTIVYFTLIIDNLQKFKYILTITVFGICKETNSYYQ